MQQMKLMLVDDEERFLLTTQKVLTKKGYKVLTAASGADALEILKHNTIHVVILDVKMPGMDGNTVLKKVKRQFPMVEVIMLTGHATVESAVDGLKSGATDYLIKPMDIEELIQKAKEAFEKRQRIEEKIRLAQFKKTMKTPREIIKESQRTQ